jgi:sugar phosphate isomerase/epimerase
MASEYFYGGNLYSTDPLYKLGPYGSFTGARMNFKEVSTVTDARTANQLKEASEVLNTGLKNIEVGAVQPDVFESIPTEHFKEINRMAKLAGAEVTMHAPMVDPTGITQHGWDKMSQKAAEEQLWDSIRKGQVLNPEKGTVVTFHATSSPLPAAVQTVMDENGKEKKVSMIVVDRSSGRITQIKEEERYFESEGGKQKVEFNPEKEIARINEENWMQKLNHVTYYAEQGGKIIEHALEKEEQLKLKELPEKKLPGLEKAYELKENIVGEIDFGANYLRDSYRNLKGLYDDAYKNAKPDEKKILEEYSDKVKKIFSEYTKDKYKPENVKEFSNIIKEGVRIMGKINPNMYENIHDFAVEKAAETTANLAFRSYNEFTAKGKAAPIIALENHPAQQALLTTGEDLRDVIKKSHDLFVEKAKAAGISEAEAKKQAEKLIGATWDVGHINMIRKYGYGEKELIKQTEAVAPYVKKVHLSDNFGMEHTELPMGMGNVPIQEIMKRIGKEGYDIKKVVEAGNWWQHFSQGSKALGPLMPSLAGMGVPIYSGAYNPVQNPGWNQMYGVPGAYFSGYGTMLPEQNFQMYGAGFSSLPTELGGQIASRDSRMSGTPMA